MDATGLRDLLERRKHTLLLVALLAMILTPVFRGAPAEGSSGLLLTLVLIAAVHTAAGRRGAVILFGTVGLIGLAGRLVSTFGPQTAYQDTVDNGGNTAVAIFLAMTIYVVYSSIARSHRISGDTILGAVAVYLLIGVMWANFYAIVYNLDENSFRFPAYAHPEADTISPENAFGYYSFVTLTTLGYGDITPMSFRARTLSALEAVFGVTYIATVIAFLVSRMMVDRQREPPDAEPRRRRTPEPPS